MDSMQDMATAMDMEVMEVTDMDTVTMVTGDMDMVDTVMDMDMVIAEIITENA